MSILLSFPFTLFIVHNTKFTYTEPMVGHTSIHTLITCNTQQLLHTKAHPTTLLIGCLTLHLLADLDIDIKELGHAPVQTHRLALVQVGFAVISWNAFLGAGFGQSDTNIS